MTGNYVCQKNQIMDSNIIAPPLED